jgi:hypothetical protein
MTATRRLHPGSLAVRRFLRFHRLCLPLLAVLARAFNPLAVSVAATNAVWVWDTVSPLADPLEPNARSRWRAVPRDILTLEANPAKAASDPGYYGREYEFQGDAVVENHNLSALFWSAQAKVTLFWKAVAIAPDHASPEDTKLGRRLLEFTPLPGAGSAPRLSRCRLVRHAGDEVSVAVSYATANGTEVSAVFAFDRTGTVDLQPKENLPAFRLRGPLAYAVVPSFIADDLIFNAALEPAAQTLCVPAENVLLGLVPGQDSMLTMTWPAGRQQARLALGAADHGNRQIEAIEFHPEGKSLWLSAFCAPGLWHRVDLLPAHLEKDVPLDWRRPFPAKWKTQLYEGDVRTTYAFRDGPAEIWRGVPGSYAYPAWFVEAGAFLHLSKKVPPKGEALIYFVEGRDTPASVSTPLDFMKATLGREFCDQFIDPAGRRLRTHHRRGAAGVRRACTCGCTEAIQAIFDVGQEADRRDEVKGAVDDMRYFVQQHVARIEEYRRFADDLIKLLRRESNAAPDLKSYLDRLGQIAARIPKECAVQKEHMKSLAYADELTRRTLALTAAKDPRNLGEYKALSEAWRAMGGAQDYVLAQCHVITRHLDQEAGYGCATRPHAVEIAQQVRKRCRECLRHPDGYEIWADY